MFNERLRGSPSTESMAVLYPWSGLIVEMTPDFDLAEVWHHFKRTADIAASNGVCQSIL